MAHEVNEAALRSEIFGHKPMVNVSTSWLTPAGRRRTSPVYEATIENKYLGKIRVLKSPSTEDIASKAGAQIAAWREQEFRLRLKGAQQDAAAAAESHAEELARAAKDGTAAIRRILAATLEIDDKLDWEAMRDTAPFPPFKWEEKEPASPEVPASAVEPKKSLFELVVPSLKQKRLDKIAADRQQWEAEVERRANAWKKAVGDWDSRRKAAQEVHAQQEATYLAEQAARNAALAAFRERVEAGEPDAIVEYLSQVFERSEYPEGFPVERKVSFDAPSQTAVVDVTLPAPDDVSDVCDYSFVKKTREAKPVTMKAKDHDELYDIAVKQTILRTAHEVFESIYTNHVASVVVNGWVTYTDKATGNDKNSCVISVGAGREAFTQINLVRVDPSVCIKSLKGLIAGPLSQVAPVQPVLQLNREDRRFIESEAVLAELNSATNLATIDWEAFEHLVRELFAKMFSAHGAEVKVTQASRDGGVDAVAFDPDPIRGGKFVIQAKRYTNVVPVSAVRDLYGTLVNEGASRGILVTTAYYGKDARAFAQDKPLTLIDGPNLAYLLEQHGHKVRIDIEEARRERN